MKNLAVVTRVHYSVELTQKQFEALEARFNRDFYSDSKCDLISILSGVTHADEVNFDGHFGAAVYFSLDADYLADAEVIAAMIKMYANKKPLVSIFEESLKSNYSHRENTKFISGFESRLGRYKTSDGQVKFL